MFEINSGKSLTRYCCSKPRLDLRNLNWIIGNKLLLTDSGYWHSGYWETRQTFNRLGPDTSSPCLLGSALPQSLTCYHHELHSVSSRTQWLVQVVRFRMEQFLSSSLCFLFIFYALAYILHRLSHVSSGVHLLWQGLVHRLQSPWVYTLSSMEHLITHDFGVPSFPHSILPTPLTSHKCFHRHYTLGS